MLTRSHIVVYFSVTRAALFRSSRRRFSTFKRGKVPKHLVSFLLRNTPTNKVVHQAHSLALTTGLLTLSLPLFNALLRCYSLNDCPNRALLLYKQLQQVCLHSSSLPPIPFDSFTYTFLVNSGINSCCPVIGNQLHCLTIKVGFQCHVYVQTSLLNMYLAGGYLDHALLLFDGMRERNLVTWNVIITGLVKWDELELARSLFDEMSEKNVVSWTGIIDGYVRLNRHGEGLALFRRMASYEGIQPSEITVLAILPAIWNVGDLRACRLIHGYCEKRGFTASDVRVANSILDAYAKCGCMQSGSKFFEDISMKRKNLVTWTSIISGFAMHGMGKEAVESFGGMEKEGFKPNQVTFLSVLNACSHGGLVEEGLQFFHRMVEDYQLLPNSKHYGCLIDMLGRTGRLEEAEKIALEVPCEISNVVIWRTLLGACSFHGNIEVGERVTNKIMEMERGYGGDYVLMHNIFAGVGRFQDAERLRKLKDHRNANKAPGYSLF
ncbi:hypothetical protein K2173_017559 [Erythroxylum novogranatense]|uniref:Pentatricopeptide repeat-containing protein n=1 Tax=Erythroxylum novogranatense TaxID=1862640 RepID=A0AAV8T8W0_9ROSI|nr:hypothetical protein K2173_017559 [Erythroxylum novogranatense]